MNLKKLVRQRQKERAVGNWSDLLVAVALLITALGTLLTAWGTFRTRNAVRETATAVGEVHTLVNARSQQQDQRIEQLTKVIEGSGDSEVPDRNYG